MDFNFERDYERFRKSDDFVEMMKSPPDFDSEKWTIQDLGNYIYTSTAKWAESHPHIPEIDWNKVPVGTKVYVSSDADKDWGIREFFIYSKKTINPYWAYSTVYGTSAYSYKYCRLVEDNPEYYKD